MRIDVGYSLNNWALPLAIWFAPKADLPIAGYRRAATLTIGPFDVHFGWLKLASYGFRTATSSDWDYLIVAAGDAVAGIEHRSVSGAVMSLKYWVERGCMDGSGAITATGRAVLNEHRRKAA